VRAGKVRYIGASNFFAWELCEAHFTGRAPRLSGFISAQDHHNLLYRDIEKRFEPFCVKYGVGMTHYFPLAAGMLSGVHQRGAIAPGTRQANNPNTASWQSDRNWDVTEKLQAFAQQRGWTLAQMSLAWLLQRPATFTVIAGADKPEHLQDNVKALQVRFTPEDLVEIDRLTLVDEDRSVAPPYRLLRPEKVHEFERSNAPVPVRPAGPPTEDPHDGMDRPESRRRPPTARLASPATDTAARRPRRAAGDLRCQRACAHGVRPIRRVGLAGRRAFAVRSRRGRRARDRLRARRHCAGPRAEGPVSTTPRRCSTCRPRSTMRPPAGCRWRWSASAGAARWPGWRPRGCAACALPSRTTEPRSPVIWTSRRRCRCCCTSARRTRTSRPSTCSRSPPRFR
jgi:hypothetical protein